MKVLIFIILCVIETEVTSKKALLLNLRWGTLDDVRRRNGDEKCYAYLTACPAASPKEKQFNKDFSLGKRSLFSRLIYAENEKAQNIVVNFCERPIKPTTLYDPIDNEYKIGYELFYEEAKTNMSNYAYYYYRQYISEEDEKNLTRKIYYRYKPVINTKKVRNHVMMNLTTPSSNKLAVKYEDGRDVKFNFTDRSRTLVFYWIEVFSVKSSKYKKQIEPEYPYHHSTGWKIKNLKDTCENYCPNDDDLYSQENQKKYLSNISVPASMYKSNLDFDVECGQPYGCLKRSQIVPLWHFNSYSARRASCSHMNFVPIWKSIADEQLRKVDLYILAVQREIYLQVTFGVSGILKMKKTTKNSNATRKMYLLHITHHRKVPIPKIIYRIIRLEASNEAIAIIIHNDPNADPKRNKLCTKNITSGSGWDEIINDDPRTGLTYLCPVTEKLIDKLEVYDNFNLHNSYPAKVLNLNSNRQM